MSRKHLVASAAKPAWLPANRELSIGREPFGTMPDGTPVELFSFGTRPGPWVRMITYGATVQSIFVPDRWGRAGDVTLGVKTLDEYRHITTFFGATIGRFANRIAHGTFTVDGTTYHVPANHPPNALHGGPDGFDKKVWDAVEIQETDRVGVRFTCVSPDMEMGFPGTLTTAVTYTVNTSDEFTINYRATVAEKATVVNLTNHAYFNLAGEGENTIYDEVMVINADRYVPVDATSIPLGPLAPVAGTPFDFTRPHRIGERIRGGDAQLLNAHGYDHNWVLNRADGEPPTFCSRLYDQSTGRVLDCFTDQPGVQVYTGNMLDATVRGVGGRVYRQGDAVTFETQHFPDSPNHPEFPSTVLRPGEVFDSTTVYRFSTD